VSVIIPVYNGDRYLAEAIESVLAQEYRPLEILVVDDGSTDESPRIARRFGSPVRCLAKPHSGLAATRNFGVAAAQGELLAFLDSDDVWLAGKLTRQVQELLTEPALDGVFGRMEQFVSPELAPAIRERLQPKVVTLASPIPSSLLIRMAAYHRVGEQDSQWRVGEFMEWLLKAQAQGIRLRMLDDLVLRRRIHASNMGIQERGRRRDYAEILLASLKRRRQQS
jgi:glycosyltransferase involved in cell wall biosynthesis